MSGEEPKAATIDPEALLQAIHDAMCDVSHHDSFHRCHRWHHFELVAASVGPRYDRIVQARR